jgi:hypothetical protein
MKLYFFSFLGMPDIACIFARYLSSLCINLFCLDIVESLRLYLPSFYVHAKVG